MDRRQFTVLWCGIAAIVLAGLTVINRFGLLCPFGFCTWVFIVAITTTALIYSLKTPPQTNQTQPKLPEVPETHDTPDVQPDPFHKQRLEKRKQGRSQADAETDDA